MPTYLLDGSSSARIPAGPLKIEVHLSHGAPFVLRALSDGQPIPAIAPRPDILVIPKLEGRAIVSVATSDGLRPFAPGTVLNVTVVIDGPPNPDPERIVLAAVDVSGLTGQELLLLELADGFVTASSFVSTEVQETLSGLAKAAQVATREILGAERVDATSAVNMIVAVDGSASMLPSLRDGSALALVEVLAGVSRVVSPGREFGGAIVGSDVTWVTGDASALARNVAEALESRNLTTSFRSSAPALAGRFPERTVAYVLTDALPADIVQLRAVDEVEGETRHLVVVTDATALALQGDPGIPVTRVDPSSSAGDLSTRLADPRVLRTVVLSLLQGCFVPGTTYAKKVAS